MIKYYKHYFYVISKDPNTEGKKLIYSHETQETWEKYVSFPGGGDYHHLRTDILGEFDLDE